MSLACSAIRSSILSCLSLPFFCLTVSSSVLKLNSFSNSPLSSESSVFVALRLMLDLNIFLAIRFSSVDLSSSANASRASTSAAASACSAYFFLAGALLVFLTIYSVIYGSDSAADAVSGPVVYSTTFSSTTTSAVAAFFLGALFFFNGAASSVLAGATSSMLLAGVLVRVDS